MQQRPAKKIERVVLGDQVYEAIKERILDQAYAPGQKLNIDGLVRELKVSSTPIREALTRLVAEGLVSAAPFVGFATAVLPERAILPGPLRVSPPRRTLGRRRGGEATRAGRDHQVAAGGRESHDGRASLTRVSEPPRLHGGGWPLPQDHHGGCGKQRRAEEL